MAYYISSSKVINNSAETIASTQPSTQYPEIEIGNQIWMTKNLDVMHYRDGTPIQSTNNEAWEFNLYSEYRGMVCDYDNDPFNGYVYGKLYNWYAVNDTRGLAPEGWHIATNSEFDTLEAYVGDSDGCKLAGDSMQWINSSGNELTNNQFFAKTEWNCLPGGFRQTGGSPGFVGKNYTGYHWMADSYNAGNAHYHKIEYDDTDSYQATTSKWHGLSVRCVKDN
jgi:uncharacterized protein (TIGR02145 family)